MCVIISFITSNNGLRLRQEIGSISGPAPYIRLIEVIREAEETSLRGTGYRDNCKAQQAYNAEPVFEPSARSELEISKFACRAQHSRGEESFCPWRGE